MSDQLSKVVAEMRSRAVNLPDIIGDDMRDWADRIESAAANQELERLTRRVAEVEKAARQWKQDAREMGRDSDPRGIWNETLVNCADRIHAALTKEPTK